MQFAWLAVTGGILVLYLVAESLSERWPRFRRLCSIRLFHRSEHVDIATRSADGPNDLSPVDGKLDEVLVGARKGSPGEYLLQIPLGLRRTPNITTTKTLVNARVSVDQRSTSIEMSAWLSPGFSVITVLMPPCVGCLALLAGKPGAAAFFLVMFYVIEWVTYKLRIKQQLEDLWFLLTAAFESRSAR